jgi:hypothetical protein
VPAELLTVAVNVMAVPTKAGLLLDASAVTLDAWTPLLVFVMRHFFPPGGGATMLPSGAQSWLN